MKHMAENKNSTTKPVRRPVAVAAFVSRESGGATVEAVLWLPFFLFVFMLIVDVSVILNNQNVILRVVQDANRGLSVGRYESSDETAAAITTRLAYLSDNVTATTTVNAGVIDSQVTVPAADLDVIGVAKTIAAANLTINAQHFLEQ